MSIIDKICDLMNYKKITQKQLTDYLGLDKSTFSQWKSGKNQSYLKYISQIADFLNVPEYYLKSEDLKLNFIPHELDDEYIIECPVCGYDCTHFIGIKPVDFGTYKSDGIAIEFHCEDDHTFYLIIDSYKGNTYAVYTDESCTQFKPANLGMESMSTSLLDMVIKEITKKYHALDEHGKKAVESILDIEYKRCTETNRNKSKTITFKRFNVNKASAGCGYDLSNSDVWREIEVIDTPEVHEADFAVEVDGHSMEPTISDGSIVYIATDSDVPVGEIGLFRQNGAGYIKEKGSNRLISHNPDYPDILPENGEIVCIGRVIGIAKLPD